MQTRDRLKAVREKYRQAHNSYEGGYRCAICWHPWIKETHGDDCVVGALSNAIEQIEQLRQELKSLLKDHKTRKYRCDGDECYWCTTGGRIHTLLEKQENEPD